MPATSRDRGAGHICIFTTAHPTDDVRVHSKIAASFLDAGYSVSWVGPARAYFTDSVEVDPRIHYCLTHPSTSRLGRLAASWKISLAARSLGPVDWWYSPDPDAARAAIKVAKRQGGRVIFDIHEVYHGALLDRWLHGHKLRLLRALVESAIVRTSARSDLVIGVNASVMALYAKRDTGALVVRNCAPAWFSGESRTIVRADTTMSVMHGKIIATNGTPVVLAALEAAGPPLEGIRVIMVDVAIPHDDYASSVRRHVSTSASGGAVDIIQGVPHHEMPSLLESADVGMIAYGRGLGEDSLPNRLFEYMAAGLAVLAPAYATEIVQILNTEGVGITADFDDPVDVARALTWLRDHSDERAAMGARGRQAFLARHSWETEFEKLTQEMNSWDDRACR